MPEYLSRPRTSIAPFDPDDLTNKEYVDAGDQFLFDNKASISHAHDLVYEPLGAVTAAIIQHENASNPHPQYALDTDLDAYLPLAGGTLTGTLNAKTLNVNGLLNVYSGATALTLRAWNTGQDHVYMSWHPRNADSTRGAYAGYGGEGSTTFQITSEIGHFTLTSASSIILNPATHINAMSKQVVGLADGTSANHAVSKGQLDDHAAASDPHPQYTTDAEAGVIADAAADAAVESLRGNILGTAEWAVSAAHADYDRLFDLTGNNRDAVFSGAPTLLPHDGSSYIHVWPRTDGWGVTNETKQQTAATKVELIVRADLTVPALGSWTGQFLNVWDMNTHVGGRNWYLLLYGDGSKYGQWKHYVSNGSQYNLINQSAVEEHFAQPWLRWVKDGIDISFYTSDDGVNWTQRGLTMTDPDAANSGQDFESLTVGGGGPDGNSPLEMKVHSFTLRCDDQVVASFDADEADPTTDRAPVHGSWTGDWRIESTVVDVPMVHLDVGDKAVVSGYRPQTLDTTAVAVARTRTTVANYLYVLGTTNAASGGAGNGWRYYLTSNTWLWRVTDGTTSNSTQVARTTGNQTLAGSVTATQMSRLINGDYGTLAANQTGVTPSHQELTIHADTGVGPAELQFIGAAVFDRVLTQSEMQQALDELLHLTRGYSQSELDGLLARRARRVPGKTPFFQLDWSSPNQARADALAAPLVDGLGLYDDGFTHLHSWDDTFAGPLFTVAVDDADQYNKGPNVYNWDLGNAYGSLWTPGQIEFFHPPSNYDDEIVYSARYGYNGLEIQAPWASEGDPWPMVRLWSADGYSGDYGNALEVWGWDSTLGYHDITAKITTSGKAWFKKLRVEPPVDADDAASKAYVDTTGPGVNLLHPNVATGTDLFGDTTGVVQVTGSMTSTNTDSYRGDRCLRLVADGGTGRISFYARSYDVVPGETYTARWVGKWESPPTISAQMRATLDYYDEAGSRIRVDAATVDGNATDWLPVTCTSVAPAGTHEVKVAFYRNSGGAGDVLLVDDASLVQGTYDGYAPTPPQWLATVEDHEADADPHPQYLPLAGGTLSGPVNVVQAGSLTQTFRSTGGGTSHLIYAGTTSHENARNFYYEGTRHWKESVNYSAWSIQAMSGTIRTLLSVNNQSDTVSVSGALQVNNKLVLDTDHTAASDPHTDYLNNSRGDARYYTKAQSDAGYVAQTGGTVTGSLAARSFNQYRDATSRQNLGNPSAFEAALFEAQSNNKLWFYDRANVDYEVTWDGTNWEPDPNMTDDRHERFFAGAAVFDGGGYPYIPNGCVQYRITINNNGNYVYLNDLYLYMSPGQHRTQLMVERRYHSTGVWSTVKGDDVEMSGWPAHQHIPHGVIAFASTAHYDAVRLTFTPRWITGGSHDTMNISLYALEWWGGYPAGRRTIYNYNRLQQVKFPAELFAEGNKQVLTTDHTAAADPHPQYLPLTGGTMSGPVTVGDINNIYAQLGTDYLWITNTGGESAAPFDVYVNSTGAGMWVDTSGQTIIDDLYLSGPSSAPDPSNDYSVANKRYVDAIKTAATNAADFAAFKTAIANL